MASALALVFSAGVARADDDIDAALKAADAASQGDNKAAGEAKPAAAGEPLPDIGKDQLAVFVLQRGFYFTSDVGMFMTFGGVNGHSNVQPFLSIKGGFDINDWMSVQLAIAHGYASGNPVSGNEDPSQGGQGTFNYSLLNFGGEVVFAVRPTERFAIEPRVGGGLSRIYPQLTSPSDPSSTLGPTAPYVTGGVAFNYLTLLTDFTAGLSVSEYFILGPNIPGTAAAFQVRYTF